jgi:hypothetical protein
MQSKLKEFLNNCPPLWRVKNLRKHQEYIDLLNILYPNVPLDIQVHSFKSGNSPYCVICKSTVKKAGKQTCSLVCRSIHYKQDINKHLEKRKQTLLDIYGVTNSMQIPDVLEKRNNTMILKYGALVSDLTRQKARERSADLNIKGKLTIKEKYNVDNSGQLPDHGTKCRATMLTNYGVEHYTLTDNYIKKTKIKRIEKWSTFTPDNIELISLNDPSIDKQTVFNNPNSTITFQCQVCHTIECLPTETYKWRINNTGTCCGKCNNLNKGSMLENEVRKYIHSLGIITSDHNRIELSGKEIDIFVPEKRIGVEFNGLYWHNDLKCHKRYHIDKFNLALGNNIQLIQIFEDEWLHKIDIVKSRLAYLLGKNQKTIYARKCIIKEVHPTIASNFLNQNHIQGNAKSSIKLGLYYNNELVSLMTFSKPNLSKGQKKEDGFWELLRFCNLLNTSVVGGANRLLHHFVKTYLPVKILSFADKRWSLGKLYQTLGFVKQKDSSINYWYIDRKESKRIHRFSLRKNKNDNQDLTEYENRLAQGYLRIWDCGSSKWLWTNDSK